MGRRVVRGIAVMAITSNCQSLVAVLVMGCVPFQKTCLGPYDGSRRREQRQNVHCVGTFLLNPHSLCKFGDHSTNGPPRFRLAERVLEAPHPKAGLSLC